MLNHPIDPQGFFCIAVRVGVVSLIRLFTQHWLSITTLAYLLTFIVWRHLILPLEISLTSDNAIFASFLFLPHAVRVLSAWLLAPKSLIAMIPAAVAVSLISGASPPQDYELLLEVMIETSSASAMTLVTSLLPVSRS